MGRQARPGQVRPGQAKPDLGSIFFSTHRTSNKSMNVSDWGDTLLPNFAQIVVRRPSRQTVVEIGSF